MPDHHEHVALSAVHRRPPYDFPAAFDTALTHPGDRISNICVPQYAVFDAQCLPPPHAPGRCYA